MKSLLQKQMHQYPVKVNNTIIHFFVINRLFFILAIHAKLTRKKYKAYKQKIIQ